MRLKEKWRSEGGDWALVTGACSGIGLAIAERLASMGYSVAIADIDADGVRKTESDIHTRYGVGVRGIEIDLARMESAGRLHDWCAREQIEPLIVVNNAGVFSYKDILDTDVARIEKVLALHVLTVSVVCRLFGGDMARRGRGYILNMSSYSMWMPWPGLALYSSTKSYIRNFSKSLSYELGEKGVGVTTVLPAGVTTGLYGLSDKWQRIGRSLGVLLTPESTAEVSLAAMFRRRKQYVPGFLMRMLLPLVKNLPSGIIAFARRKTIRYQK